MLIRICYNISIWLLYCHIVIDFDVDKALLDFYWFIDDDGNRVDLKKSLRYDTSIGLEVVEEEKKQESEKDEVENDSIFVEKMR